MSQPEETDQITKTQIEHKNDVHLSLQEKTTTSETDPNLSPSSFTPKQEARIIRRIDLRIVVLLGSMYAVSLIDRSQIGLAMITGMGKDLSLLTASRYNTLNAVFFAPYVVLQLPSTVILRKIGPRVFLSGITMGWGLVTLGCGFVRDWKELGGLRVVLGGCEAGFFPACVYLLSVWYPRYDLQKRLALLLILGLVPAAFSGLLAFGISHLEGHGSGPNWWGSLNLTTGNHAPGIAGWRWIFILYDVVTCVISIIAWFLLVDFPEKIALGDSATTTTTKKKSVKFLTKAEAAWAVERIERDREDVLPSEFHLPSYLHPLLTSHQIWSFALLYLFQNTISYGIGFALPFILTEGMGFSVAISQCLVTPPYVLAAVTTWFVALYADKWRVRSPFIVGNCLVVIIGLCLIGFVNTVSIRYLGVFLAALPSTANGPCVLAWQANNVRGQWKRALISALSVGFGAIGGIKGSLVFRTQDGPHYMPGIVTCLAAAGLIIAIVFVLNLKFIKANREAAAGGKLVEGLEGFRYTL